MPNKNTALKKEFDGIFTNLADRYQHHGIYLWEWIESKLEEREKELERKIGLCFRDYGTGDIDDSQLEEKVMRQLKSQK